MKILLMVKLVVAMKGISDDCTLLIAYPMLGTLCADKFSYTDHTNTTQLIENVTSALVFQDSFSLSSKVAGLTQVRYDGERETRFVGS